MPTPSGSTSSIATRVVKVRLAELKLLDRNARFMAPAMFQRLVDNLRRDGCLTSLPTVYRQAPDGPLSVLSGNHRVQAGIKAGIEHTDVLEITSPLTEQQLVAIQLSHNAITGKDDPSILKELWGLLDFDLKEYSGLTDDLFKVEELDVSVLKVEQPLYHELTISFLPADKAAFDGYLSALTKAAKSKKTQPERHVADAANFDAFFDTLIAVKEKYAVHNSAIALKLMAELATDKLADP
ncbi:MAG: hypothetical protein GC191_08100 [Azospirillum sp.]|nr:hypothetical protein [Azospirillum sp.]